jgi:AcrR family transcriptional regulator
MMMNSKQKTNKDMIIEHSTRLFYDNGLNNTSFDEIARSCGITKPLITYHFVTKANLAKEVADKITAYINNYVSERVYKCFDEYDLQYSTAAAIIQMLRLYNEDEKARRFFCDYLNLGFEVQLTANFIRFYKIHERQLHFEVDKSIDELTMLSTSALFSTFSLAYAYFTGRLNCSFDDFCDYAVRLNFQFMKVDDNRIYEIMKEGKNILEKLDIKVLPYFRLE